MMARRVALFVLACLLVVLLTSKETSHAFAAQLTGVSDTISTSRPSAAAPLNSNAASGVGQVTVVDNNSVYLASDSATLYADPAGGGETSDLNLNVSSMSAQIAGTPNTRTVNFTNDTANTHHKGDPLVVPITALHVVKFITQSSIPVGGKIAITFPASGASDSNQASPSASTFMFNGLTTGNIQANFSSGSTTCSFAISGTSAGSSPAITCTTATAIVNSGVTVTILIGCSAQSGGACTTQVPTLINPTRGPTDTLAGGGVATTQADTWKIHIDTQDSSSSPLDSATAVVGTIESVQVQANVDPTLTFQITGIGNSVNVNSGHGSGCPSEVTNAGFGSNATFVNLGTVGTGINIAAQDATVSTNGQGGYVLTATASGHLIDNSNGYAISDPGTTPAIITAATEKFGVHPCGTDANASFVPGSAVSGGGGGKVAWPTQTSGITLASRNTVANAIITTIEYAITASAITPAGLYNTVITYVATPTFN